MSSPPKKQRDLRLDFYRGIAMFIILIAHTPGNIFNNWIPARWGFSDATEMFVFCSGMASAIAFGGSYTTSGWRLGTARVLFRCWQIYWVHIGLFIFTFAMLYGFNSLGLSDKNYINSLNLGRLNAEPAPQVAQFMTLSYVPNYFDILPMYFVVLLMLPMVMALQYVHKSLVFAMMIALWVLAQENMLETIGLERYAISFAAEPWSERPWFFNPFGWQLLFFTGFAFMRGWLPRPPIHWILVVCATLVVLANISLSNIGARVFGFEMTNQWRAENQMWIIKTNFGVLRYVQFLALAYLGYVIAGDRGARLRIDARNLWTLIANTVVQWILKVGQQSLAVFVFSMALARVLGFVMDQVGRELWQVVSVNLLGGVLLILCAYGAGWFKGQPWKRGRVTGHG